MPLIYVQRRANLVAKENSATQYIVEGGTLAFTGPTVVELSPLVFTTADNYVLFDYSGGTFDGAQMVNLSVDASATSFTNAALTHEDATSRIIVSLS